MPNFVSNISAIEPNNQIPVAYALVTSPIGNLSAPKLIHQFEDNITEPLSSVPTSAFSGEMSQESYSMVPLEDYDYKGALLFVMGLLSVYGLAILFLIISLIRKSRTELELVDHLQDFEAMQRATVKRRTRDSIRSSLGSTDGIVAPAPSCSSSVEEPNPPILRPAIRRPILQRSQRVEDEDDDDFWLNYKGERGFRKPGRILTYNPSLLRDDTFEKDDIDFIIVWRTLNRILSLFLFVQIKIQYFENRIKPFAKLTYWCFLCWFYFKKYL